MTKREQPIRRWHVGLVADLKAGKNVGIEAAAAIENLEDLLFRAETEVKTLCHHEPYQGRCAHCDVPFRFGRPDYGETE